MIRDRNDKPTNGKDIRSALEVLLKGLEINPNQKHSVGYNIKWK